MTDTPSTAINPQDPHYIQSEQYSGPLDLLLQLIRKQEMDIFKIDIYKITQKYVEHIQSIPTPDIENAGDFIRMAAMLMHIKSKSILPKEEEEEETSDLKKDLVRLLINYQKYQTVGNILYQKNLLGRDSWLSPYELRLKAVPNDEIEIDRDKASFLLIQKYHKLLQKEKIKTPHKTNKPLPSLLDRVKELTESFIQGAKTSFFKLISIRSHKHSRLLTFLSLLELSKLGLISLIQKGHWTDIDVEVKKTLDRKDFILLDNEEKDWMSQKLREGINENI